MKKVLVGGLILVFLLGTVATGFCWPWEKNTAQKLEAKGASTPEALVKAAPAPQQAKEPATPSKAALDKERILRDKKRGLLNNYQWDIDIFALSGKGKTQKDNLIFVDNKFSSENYKKMGFNESNYTLTLLENGAAIIETMQTSEKEGTIFWRIEFDQALTVCKGVLSHQHTGNKTEDYSFVSLGKKAVQAKEAVLKEATPPVVPQAEKK